MNILRGSEYKASLDIFPVLRESLEAGVRQLRALGVSPHRQLRDPWENPLRTAVTLLGAPPMTLCPVMLFPFLPVVGLLRAFALSIRVHSLPYLDLKLALS